MKLEVKIDSSYKTPLCIIYTDTVTDEINEYIKKLSSEKAKILTGKSGDMISVIKQDEIINICSANGKVYAVTEKGEFIVNQRLYELENSLDCERFVRISNSEIINLEKVKGFNLKLSGTIYVSFNDGRSTYVSRRYVSKIKERLGV